MSVYNINGVEVSPVYDFNGQAKTNIYDYLGNFEGFHYTKSVLWSSKGVASTQGYDIYDDKVFWVAKSGNDTLDGKLYVYDLQGNKVIDSPTTIYGGHANCVNFSNEFYDEGDNYPLCLMSTAYSNANGCAYLNRIKNDYTCELVRTYKFDIDDVVITGGFDVCYGEDYNTVYTACVIGSNSEYVPGGKIIISKWDISNCTENADGTLTPTFISTVDCEWHYWKQGIKYHNGLIWFASGYPNYQAWVYAFNPTTGQTVHAIDCETTTEIEGAVFYNDEMYVGFQKMAMHKYTFNS